MQRMDAGGGKVLSTRPTVAIRLPPTGRDRPKLVSITVPGIAGVPEHVLPRGATPAGHGRV